MIVSPTKVGYIIMATDTDGLNRKFDAKQRKLSKPAVVLCGNLEELFELAELNDKARQLYTKHFEQDILLGCILPWSEKGKEKLKAHLI
jgi:tRNA A37 threonylcarbamoyladenosine synthetase subunit TsaC/SUA5/YrdC